MTDVLNNKTKFTYDANGNLMTVTDAKNQTITYTYDVWDNVASMTDQLGKTEHYGYDLRQNLTTLTDRKGQQATYSYDYLDRLTDIQYADGSYKEYTYDAGGRLANINDSISGMINRSYDNRDRLINETSSLGSISYAYDAIGRRTKMTVAGQPEVNYGYDVNDRLTEILSSSPLGGEGGGEGDVFSIAYDALGRRTSLELPNGVKTNYTYDNASHLLSLEHLNPLNEILEKISYAYDANGNRTKMDRANMPVKLPNPASNITYTSANQQITFNDKNITYDDNGNMTTVTNSCGTTTYVWDARNRMNGLNGFNADCSAMTASFKYDAFGRRIEKTVNGKTTNYLYDGMDIVQEIEDGTVTANYIRTLNIDEPLARMKSNGTILYYQQDALGSIIALADETGTIKTQYNYDPFGNAEMIGETSDNPFQYTGRENDGTGLYGYRFRYYSSELQRFISEDPIGLVGGINKFAYVNNQPLQFRDPFGLQNQTGFSGISFGGTLGIIDVSGKGSTTTISLTTPQLGAGFNLNFNTGLPSLPNFPSVSIGWEHMGVTIPLDLSSVSINVGYSVGPLPLNVSVPIYTHDWSCP